MTEAHDNNDEAETTTYVQDDDGDWDDRKVFVSRIPGQFDEVALKRLVEEKLDGENAVQDVSLSKPREEDDEEPKQSPGRRNDKQEHRGFAFITMRTPEFAQRVLKLGSIRGGAKTTSKKKFTVYLRPVLRENGVIPNPQKRICFLWTNFRCPYGEECKFVHEGDGGCLEKKKGAAKKKKCFDFKKGKCKLGDKCPHSHDFEVAETPKEKRADNEKDCINWKSKGKCRKGDKCPYRHEEAKRKKKRKGPGNDDESSKNRQPLSIRVFGLNYDTVEADIREFFKDCGVIVEVTFPKFEDSGRSKGYCGVLFQSPKAVAKAVEFDGQELQGRWLQIQAGKMYLKQWEEHHEQRRDPARYSEDQQQAPEEPLVGEFGQKVKRRKQHGYKE